MRRSSLSLVAVLSIAARPVLAHPGGEDSPLDRVVPSAPTYKADGVSIDEHLGARVPLYAQFRTADGANVTLGQVLAGDLPTILTFNYSDCPMLCSLQLNGLSAALPAVAVPAPGPDGKTPVALRAGGQFRVVTIDLESNEPIEKLAKMRDRYVDRVAALSATAGGGASHAMSEAERKALRSGWTFLAAATPGDGAAIRRVAEAVGFKYTYVPERAEWAHPAALILLAPSGAVTRYVYGIEFETAMLRESIFKAGQAEPASTVGFLNRCYHYDPDASSHAKAGVLAMRIGAAGFMVLMILGFGLMHFLKKQRRHGVT